MKHIHTDTNLGCFSSVEVYTRAGADENTKVWSLFQFATTLLLLVLIHLLPATISNAIVFNVITIPLIQ
jgi:hypothetical protein